MSKARPLCDLKHTEALTRFESIRTEVDYQILLNLHKGTNYSGIVRITFFAKKSSNIFLDFVGDEITSLIVNGSNVDISGSNLETIFKDGHIFIDEALITSDSENTIKISFNNRYWNDGNGLHTYGDIDGGQYLYIQSEPSWNNRVIPLFDQPNLKGFFTFTTIMPSEWIAVTSTEVSSKTAWDSESKNLPAHFSEAENFDLPKNAYTIWTFPKSKLLPSYLFSFVAGDYIGIELEESKRFNNLPMTFYCRRSLKEYGEKEAHVFFEAQCLSIEFFSETFGLPFMFEKADMIICPEYTIGAMEYPGAITFTERYLPRAESSKALKSARVNTTMHEVSHMWFGDCVSVEWWNDTWLKESFADLVSFICNEKTRDRLTFETVNPWISFLNRKKWGYKEDRQCTSHPIAAVVKSTQ